MFRFFISFSRFRLIIRLFQTTLSFLLTFNAFPCVDVAFGLTLSNRLAPPPHTPKITLICFLFRMAGRLDSGTSGVEEEPVG